MRQLLTPLMWLHSQTLHIVALAGLARGHAVTAQFTGYHDGLHLL